MPKKTILKTILKKYRNTSVIVNKINTGQTGGINTGLKKY